MRLWSALLWCLVSLAAFAPASAQSILLPGRNTNDQFLAPFWAQNRNASNLVQGLNANAGTNRFTGALLPGTITNALAGNTVSGLWPVSSDLTFDGDPVAPNTNWVNSVQWQNLELLGNAQTKEVNWYGKENAFLRGGTVTVQAYTNLSFVTPGTAGVFTSNNMVMALTGQFDANGNPVADFVSLDDSRFAGVTAGKVVGIHATSKKLTASSVDIGDVASAAAVNAKLAATNGVAVNLTTPSAPSTGNSVVNKTALDAAVVAAANFPLSASGLTLSIGAGTLTDGNGAPVAVPATAVRLQPSRTNHVVISLRDLSAHAYTRAWDDGSVAVGLVVTGTNSVTSISSPRDYRIRPGRSATYLARANAAQPVRVFLVGDSISGFAGTAPYWWQRSFDTNHSAYGQLIPGATNTGYVFVRVSEPGVGIEAGLPFISTLGTTPTTNTTWTYDKMDQAFFRFPSINNRLSSPDSYVGANQVAAANPDLVVLELGGNDETDPTIDADMQRIEMQIAYWRARGASVAVLPAFRKSDVSVIAEDPAWRTLADTYGATLVDAAEAIRELYSLYQAGLGPNPTSDGTHLSATGAAAVSSLLLGAFHGYTAPAEQPGAAARQVALSSASFARPAPAVYSQFVQNIAVGTGYTNGFTDNLRTLLINSPTNQGAIAIPAGGYVTASFPFVSGSIWAIVENQTGDPYNFTFGQPGAPSVINSGADNGTTQNAHFVLLGTTAQVLAAASSSRGSQYDQTRTNGLPLAIGARFTVTSGVCRFVGFMFEAPAVAEVPIAASNLNGSWVLEPADFAGGATSQSVWSTDNVNDALTITVPDCDAVAVMLRVGEKSGTVDVMTDGLTAWSGLDTYRGSYPALLPLVTAGGAWPNSAGTSTTLPLKGARGTHTVTVKLSGFTTGAPAPSAGVRRLSVAGVYALKFGNP